MAEWFIRFRDGGCKLPRRRQLVAGVGCGARQPRYM